MAVITVARPGKDATLLQDLRQARYHAGSYAEQRRTAYGVTGAYPPNHPKYNAILGALERFDRLVIGRRNLTKYLRHHHDDKVRNLVWSIQATPTDKLEEFVRMWDELNKAWVNATSPVERDDIADTALALEFWDWYRENGWNGYALAKQEGNAARWKTIIGIGAGVASAAAPMATPLITTVGKVATGAIDRETERAREATAGATGNEVNEQLRRQVERTIRALIKIESNGRADAVSPSGNHFGILQIGEATASDVGYSARDALNPETAIRIFMLSMQRSASIHRWDPMLMAFRWKAGTGTLKEFLAKAEVMGKAKALQTVASTGSSWRSAIPEYLRRFVRAWNNQ